MSSLTAVVFDRLMKQLSVIPDGTLAVAVSGGADSLCLAICLKRWADQHKRPIVALMVDHCLGDICKEQPEWVAEQLARYHVPLVVLTWQGSKPKTGLEEKARQARYRLLLEYCHTHRIQGLFMAHHAEDQVETFWMHLARSSGLLGLSGIKPVSLREGVWLLRPLLSVEKKDILTTLKMLNQPWFEDPMNQDPAFERVFWRQEQDVFSQRGLTVHKVEHAVARLARAESALGFYEECLWQAHVRILPQGVAVLDRRAFDTLPTEMQLRLMKRALRHIGQSERPLSLAALEAWVIKRPIRMTIATCHVIQRREALFVSKEKARQEKIKSIKAFTSTKWDRFLILATADMTVQGGKPSHKDPFLPVAVQESFPQFPADTQVIWDVPADLSQKELEKQVKLHYNKENKKSVYIRFIPEIKE